MALSRDWLAVLVGALAALLVRLGILQSADLANLSRWAFLFTFAGIGLRADVRALARQGWRPLAVGVAGACAIRVFDAGDDGRRGPAVP